MNKPVFKKRKSLLFVVPLLCIVLYVASFFGSFLSFSSNDNFSYRDLRSKLIKESEEELVLSTRANYEEELWGKIYEENTSSEPFTNCASRFSEETTNDNQTIFLFDIPHYTDNNYSYNHIYGYDSVWPKLKEGTIIVSSDFYNKHPNLSGLSFPTTNDSILTLDIIGYCEGKANNDRSHLGNIFADSFGFFGYISQEDMNLLNIDGFIKVISAKQNSRFFNLETKKWLSNYNFTYKDTCFSSRRISDLFDFYSYASNKPHYRVIGSILLVIGFLITAACIGLIKKAFPLFSKKMEIVLGTAFVVFWVVLSIIFARISLSLGGYTILVSDTGSMLFPTFFSLIIGLIICFEIIPVSQNDYQAISRSSYDFYYKINI